MSSFTENLTLTYIPSTNLWMTDREFSYFVGEENSQDKITVPKGFTTDLASVPWPASMFIPPDGRYNQAAVLHDYLYSIQTRPRIGCDRIFLEAMKILGVNVIKRLIMYKAVRLWGWLPWNEHKKNIKKA